MSVVGPRPLLVRYLPLYNEYQARRHEVRPGFTGYAQVHGRNSITWEDKFDKDVCERAQAIDYEKDGTLKNPGRWKTISKIGCRKPSYSLNPSPGGGCLIPYNSFYKDAKNAKKIKELAYKNDDL